MADTITDDGVRIHWTENGPVDAPPLLFCNSIGTSTAMWNAQVAALAGRFRVIRHDARGHGRSGAPEGYYSIEQLARDAVTVLDAARVGRAHVCGLSLGGVVAQRMALDYPHRLDRLILANTASRIGTEDGGAQRIAAVENGGMAAIADMAISRFFSPHFIARRPDAVAPIQAALLSTSARGYVGACAALRDTDLTETLKTITLPTLVIGGTLDVSTPPDQTQALAEALNGARHVVLEAAHLSNIEQPDEFSFTLASFLDPDCV